MKLTSGLRDHSILVALVLRSVHSIAGESSLDILTRFQYAAYCQVSRVSRLHLNKSLRIQRDFSLMLSISQPEADGRCLLLLGHVATPARSMRAVDLWILFCTSVQASRDTVWHPQRQRMPTA